MVDVDIKPAVLALVISLLPAFGGYMIVSIAINQAAVAAFLLLIPVLTYLLYQRESGWAMLGGMCFYLAIEALLTPLMFLMYTFAFASEETQTAAEQAGAAIGGGLLVVGAFVIGIPVAGVLYLISRRLEG